MATITIAADGTGDYLAPNASAYAALDTGTTANTINWKPGVYRPTTGRWWGRTASRAMTKRCTHQVSGSGTVLLDARIYVPLVASDYVRWDAPSGTWRIELYTCVVSGTVDSISDVWFGAETGDSPSDLVMGSSYAPAASLAQCNADGLTIAGMSTGAGIWFPATETSEVDGAVNAQVIYVWCPLDDAQLPAVQWGGIAAVASQSGGVSAGTPRYGAFCFARDTAASANDPSGSYVGPGFVLVGSGKNLIGSSYANDADPSLPISDVHYDSVVMRGFGLDAMYVGSDQAGTVYSGWVLDGDWICNDHRDPTTYPMFTDVNNRSVVFVDDRATAIEVDGGTITCGNLHAGIEVDGAASGEARPANCKFTNITMSCLTGANDSRWAAVTEADDTVIARCTISGFVTRGQFGGVRTLLHGNHISGWNVSTITTHWSSATIRIRTGGDTDKSTVSVKLYANYIDLRGSDPDYVWAAFDLSADGANTIPANCIDARDNVVLVEDATQACFRAVSVGGASWSATQNWYGGWTNTTTQAYSSTGSTSQGTGQSLSSLFSTGTVTAPITDNSTDLITRGDIAIMRSAPEAGASCSC